MTRTSRLLVVALVGCAPTLTSPKLPEPVAPATFEHAGADAAASVAAMDWRTYFADEHLNALIAEALAHNLDLQLALQRIELARADVRATTGLALPQVSAFAGASLDRYGRFTADGSGIATTDIMPGRPTPNPVPELGVGLEASWEPDLWGRLRNLRGAARARYLASLEGTNLVITNLVAEVAIAYFELLATDHVREVLRETITRQAQALEVVRAQKEAGRANELAVQQFEAQVAKTRAMDAAAVQRTRELEYRLGVVLGRAPGSIPRAKELLRREVATTVGAGVPSELLRNRPDIRAAELQLQASRLEVQAARAAFYPAITLTARAGYSSFSPRYLFSTPESILASIAGGLLAPLLNRRGLEAGVAAAHATQLQALFEYRRTVLAAFAEVETTLSALQQSSEVVAQRARARTAMAGTVEAADALFRAGKASYLEVLLAQQGTFEAELELVEAQRDQHVTSVLVYKALGGGWRGTLRPGS